MTDGQDQVPVPNQDQDQEPVPDQDPTVVIAGTFVVYDDGDGGFVLVCETNNNGIVRKHITKRIVRLMGPMLGQLGGGQNGLE